MEAPMLAMLVLVLTAVVLWSVAIFAVRWKKRSRSRADYLAAVENSRGNPFCAG